MHYFLRQLKAVKEQRGSKAKVELLKKMDSPSLRDILYTAFSPTVVLGIGQVPFADGDFGLEPPSLEEFLVLVQRLATRDLKGDEAKRTVLDFVNRCPEEVRELAADIFRKRLSIGCDSKRINQAFPALIPVFGVQLAEIYKPGIMDLPAWASKKLDGMRCLAFVKGRAVTLFTRTGKPIDSVPHIVSALKRCPDGVYDGELMAPGGFQRTISLCRSSSPKPGYDAVSFNIFDYLTPGDWEAPKVSATERFAKLGQIGRQLQAWEVSCLKIVEHVKIRSTREFLALHEQYKRDGYEGTMLQWDGPYVQDRGNHLLKYKDFLDTTVKVLGVIPGTGKFKGMMGALEVQCIKTGIKTELGSGFTDEDRKKNDWLGAYLDMEYQELTESTPPSFRFPSYVRRRDDCDRNFGGNNA